MVVVRPPSDPILARLLAGHPEVKVGDQSPSPANTLEWDQDGWQRRLLVGDQVADVRGLVELMDNNPLVCADTACVPSPVATLVTLALGPVVRAGLVQAEPAIHLAQPTDQPEDVQWHLENLGYKGGAFLGVEEADFGRVLVANAMVEIPLMDDYADIDDLFDEAYGRSFYIHRIDEEEWDTKLVDAKPFAAYRLRLTPGEATALLTVQTMSDRDGKCGACQTLHAFNVMCGFEESLGIPSDLNSLA